MEAGWGWLDSEMDNCQWKNSQEKKISDLFRMFRMSRSEWQEAQTSKVFTPQQLTRSRDYKYQEIFYFESEKECPWFVPRLFFQLHLVSFFNRSHLSYVNFRNELYFSIT